MGYYFDIDQKSTLTKYKELFWDILIVMGEKKVIINLWGTNLGDLLIWSESSEKTPIEGKIGREIEQGAPSRDGRGEGGAAAPFNYWPLSIFISILSFIK